jgi:hypothetical protein
LYPRIGFGDADQFEDGFWHASSLICGGGSRVPIFVDALVLLLTPPVVPMLTTHPCGGGRIVGLVWISCFGLLALPLLEFGPERIDV